MCPVAFQCRGCKGPNPPLPKKWWNKPCPNCGRWYNIKEVYADIPGAAEAEPIDGEPISLQDAINHAVEVPRIESDMEGLDYVLGGGFASNGIYLLCGDPGVGKTTVVLQILRNIALLRRDTLYVTGEQFVSDIALRAKSFGKFPGRMAVMRETSLDRIIEIAEDKKPRVLAIDSAQTLVVVNELGRDLDVGSATSIKTAARILTEFSKANGICVIMIGHVTKDGAISGPRSLEHYVDCSLYLAGNETNPARVLRCDAKNRYGQTPRRAEFLMTQGGLVEAAPEEVEPPSPPQSASATPRPPDEKRGTLISVPAEIWRAPDGTTAAAVLVVDCDHPDCLGRVDRACTAANGERERGFHESRIAKAREKSPEKKEAAPETPEAKAADPFDKPLGAPPKVKSKQRKRATKTKTAPPPKKRS